MSPLEYIPLTREKYADRPPYRWSEFESAPMSFLEKPLSQCRLALVSSGGVHFKSERIFDPERDNLVFAEIPRGIKPEELTITHNYYDSTDARRDINCIFPIERLRELVEEGFLASLAETNYSFNGRVFSRTKLLSQMAPWLLGRLREEEVDCLFLVPA